jgi:ketosteroid isomerase-like protein
VSGRAVPPYNSVDVSSIEDAVHPNEQVVRDLYAARERGDLDAVGELLAPDIDWHEPYEYLGDIKGRDRVLEALREAVDATTGTFRIDLHDVLANDDHAVALVQWSARREGRHMRGQEIGVYHVRDGVVREVWFTTNDPGSVTEFFR